MMTDEQTAEMKRWESARDFWRAKFQRLNLAANAVMNLAYTDECLSARWSGDSLRIALEELEAACDPDFAEAAKDEVTE